VITRRRFIAASTLALGGLASPARAQVITKQARILIGYPPGGSIDAVARVLAEKIRGTYAPAVVVENRPGNRAAVAVQGLMSSPPDGSAMMMAPHSVTTVWPHVYKNLSYDALKDLVPVTTVNYFDFAFVVRADVPATTLAEYVEWAKANPRENGMFGITGAVGGTPHFIGMLFAQSAGLQLTPVPYKGTVQGIQDLLGGQIPAWIGPLGDIERFHRAGKARVLATTGQKRSRFLPQAPSFLEAGHPAVVVQERFGIWLRAGASAAAVRALNKSMGDALEDPEVKSMCEKFTSEAGGSTPEQFETIIRQEYARWGGIIKSTGYQPED
jgi:tripartite-type tricarboxylate transporter receptor subunit TctC